MTHSTATPRNRPHPYATALALGAACTILLCTPDPAFSQTHATAFGSYFEIPAGWGESVAIGDLNGDGRNDVVLGTSYGAVETDDSMLIFFQNEEGTLSAPVARAAGGAATSVAIADFTGDGKNDIAAGRDYVGGIRVFVQGAPGNFDDFTDYPTDNSHWICTGDFNNDGRSDLAGTAMGAVSVDVFLQTTNGTLEFDAQYPATYAADLEAGDVNNDGLTDIVVMSSTGAPKIGVLLQNSAGFASQVPYNLTNSPPPTCLGVGLGDLTGDGRLDVAVSHAGKIALLLQQPSATLLAGPNLGSYNLPTGVWVADIDMNGLGDILTVHNAWQRLGVYFQISPGQFSAENLFEVPYASFENPHCLAVGDLNGDRSPDVAIAYYNGLIVLTNRFPAPIVEEASVELSSIGLSNSVVLLALKGTIGRSCVIKTSSNLIHWLPWATNTIPVSGSMLITDSLLVNHPARFYRAELQATGGATSDLSDSFGGRMTVPPSGAVLTGSNTSATRETGEPDHGGYPGGKSVWCSWTAPSSGIASVNTDGSSFDTTVGIYTGTSVSGLTVVAEDDEGGEGHRSSVVFNATAGTTYQIAVDGFYGESGTIKLTVKPGLLNDNFSDALQISDSLDYVLGSNVGATKQTGEPDHGEDAGGKSVWWRWQAPYSGAVSFSTSGSSFDTVLAAYTGSSVSGLTFIAGNDDFGGNPTSQVTFTATAGTVYYIAVDGYDGAAGSIQLNLYQP